MHDNKPDVKTERKVFCVALGGGITVCHYGINELVTTRPRSIPIRGYSCLNDGPRGRNKFLQQHQNRW